MAKKITLDQDEKSWIRYIKRRIDNNKNFLGMFTGPTGSGKSWSTLAVAEELDPDFHIGRVCFDAEDFMKMVNSDELQEGSVLVFEEVGVALNNKNWQSVVNKMINYLLQTIRHRNFIFLVNVPFADFIDSSARKLFHAELSTQGIDFKRKQVILKPELLQYNGRYRKWYYKYLRVITPQGVVPLRRWRVGKPSKELIEVYEEKKRDFTDKLTTDILAEIKHAKRKGRKLLCKRCGHQWVPRSEFPMKCPSCGKNPWVKKSQLYRKPRNKSENDKKFS